MYEDVVDAENFEEDVVRVSLSIEKCETIGNKTKEPKTPPPKNANDARFPIIQHMHISIISLYDLFE